MGRKIGLVLILVLALAASPALAQLTAKYVLPVSKVTLSRTSAKVYAGRSFTIQAKVAPASRAHEAVLWSSSDPSVAAVKDGVVTALSPGAATITATVEDKSASCQVTVRRAKVDRHQAEQQIHRPHALQQPTAVCGRLYPLLRHGYGYLEQPGIPPVATVDPDTGLVTGVSPGHHPGARPHRRRQNRLLHGNGHRCGHRPLHFPERQRQKPDLWGQLPPDRFGAARQYRPGRPGPDLEQQQALHCQCG